MLGIRCILVIAILFQVYSFQLPSQQHGHYLVTRRVTGSLAKSNTMLRLFEGKDSLAVNANPAVTSPTLSDISKSFIQTNLGIQDSSLFADTIQISGPNFNKYMSKDKYLLETKDAWTPVQQALDNFNWNVHGIQVDAQNSQKVWLKVQPSGKFTKLFYYQDELFEPSKKEVVFPLQEWSLTFNAEGRIEAITTDYIIDRFNNAMTTNSLQGVQGLLHTVGQSPSEFAYLPPLLVMQRFLARRRKPLVPKKLSSSPFPEAVMFALTKQVLESKFGAEMPSLLSESMQVSDPIQGPWNRNEYLTEKKSLLGFLQSNGNEFEDVKVVGSNFHIDKTELDRVWCHVQYEGSYTSPSTGSKTKFTTNPEAVSISFTDKGLVNRITMGYVIDRKAGESEGLGYIYGLDLIRDKPSFNALYTRSIKDIVALNVEKIFPKEKPTTNKKASFSFAAPAIKVTAPATTNKLTDAPKPPAAKVAQPVKVEAKQDSAPVAAVAKTAALPTATSPTVAVASKAKTAPSTNKKATVRISSSAVTTPPQSNVEEKKETKKEENSKLKAKETNPPVSMPTKKEIVEKPASKSAPPTFSFPGLQAFSSSAPTNSKPAPTNVPVADTVTKKEVVGDKSAPKSLAPKSAAPTFAFPIFNAPASKSKPVPTNAAAPVTPPTTPAPEKKPIISTPVKAAPFNIFSKSSTTTSSETKKKVVVDAKATPLPAEIKAQPVVDKISSQSPAKKNPFALFGVPAAPKKSEQKEEKPVAPQTESTTAKKVSPTSILPKQQTKAIPPVPTEAKSEVKAPTTPTASKSSVLNFTYSKGNTGKLTTAKSTTPPPNDNKKEK